MSRVRLRLQQDILHWNICAYLTRVDKETGKRQVARIQWEDFPDDFIGSTGPSFVIEVGDTLIKEEPFLQDIKRELAALGALVPDAETAEYKGELKASRQHLEDMRKLVFNNNQPKGEVGV